MSDYFTDIKEKLKEYGVTVAPFSNYYLIGRTEKQKYIVPKRVYSPGTIKKRLHAEAVEKIGDKYYEYEPCVILSATSVNEKKIIFNEKMDETEKVSALVESLVAELRTSNTETSKTLLHELVNVKNQYDPRTTGIIFGHVE